MISWHENCSCITGCLWGNSPVTGGFPSQIASNAEHSCLICFWTSWWTYIQVAGDLKCMMHMWYHCNAVFYHSHEIILEKLFFILEKSIPRLQTNWLHYRKPHVYTTLVQVIMACCLDGTRPLLDQCRFIPKREDIPNALLMQWRYCSLALNHRFKISAIWVPLTKFTGGNAWLIMGHTVWWIWLNLDVFLPDGTNPLPDWMMTYHQCDSPIQWIFSYNTLASKHRNASETVYMTYTYS